MPTSHPGDCKQRTSRSVRIGAVLVVVSFVLAGCASGPSKTARPATSATESGTSSASTTVTSVPPAKLIQPPGPISAHPALLDEASAACRRAGVSDITLCAGTVDAERRHALLDCISRPARRTPASQSSLDERTLRRFPAARHVHQHDRLAEETLGTQVPAQAVYFSASQARSGTTATPLTGTRSYAIRFPAEHLPPHGSDGFWSITLYNAAGSLAANPIDRYSIGDETPGLVIGADGSLTIVVSASRPSETDVNWLPAPRGAFTRRFLVPARNPGDQLNRDGRA
jgi:hypothetical protein